MEAKWRPVRRLGAYVGIQLQNNKTGRSERELLFHLSAQSGSRLTGETPDFPTLSVTRFQRVSPPNLCSTCDVHPPNETV